eukprot:8415209-Karenia_brevis.AAC.1
MRWHRMKDKVEVERSISEMKKVRQERKKIREARWKREDEKFRRRMLGLEKLKNEVSNIGCSTSEIVAPPPPVTTQARASKKSLDLRGSYERRGS